MRRPDPPVSQTSTNVKAGSDSKQNWLFWLSTGFSAPATRRLRISGFRNFFDRLIRNIDVGRRMKRSQPVLRHRERAEPANSAATEIGKHRHERPQASTTVVRISAGPTSTVDVPPPVRLIRLPLKLTG